MALHGCDEVAVAGFGYDMSTPNAPLHYYETVRMAAIKEVPGWLGGSPLGRADGGVSQHKRTERGEPAAGLAAKSSQERSALPLAKLDP